jgi:hypothetical protein
MDFSKFLSTGELSDIIVGVDGREFKLHKFPLYTRSDFFRALARGAARPDNTDRITLTDFPGGSETFRAVSAYCYNVDVNVTSQNVCQLRCAAEFLQMSGPTNLAGLTDRFLSDMLTTAKLDRRLDAVIQLVKQCRRLGAIAEQANIVDRCLQAIVEAWLLPVSRRMTSDRRRLGADTDSMADQLSRFPLGWFAQLLRSSRDRRVSPALVTSLLQHYVDRAVDRHSGTGRTHRAPPTTDTPPTLELNDGAPDEDGNDRNLPNDAEQLRSEPSGSEFDEADDGQRPEEIQPLEFGEEEEEQEEKGDNDGEDGSDDDDDVSQPELLELSPSHPTRLRAELGTEETSGGDRDVDGGVTQDDASNDDDDDDDTELSDAELGNILDTLFGDVPTDDYAAVADWLPTNWIIAMLLLAERLNCVTSRDVILKLASCVAHRFSADELVQLAPDTFIALVQAAAASSASAGVEMAEGRTVISTRQKQQQQVCSRAVDLYLKSVSERGELNADMYRRIVDALPDECRTNDDSLFHALRELLSKDKSNDSVDGDERQSLIDSINYGRLSESALQDAFDSNLLPVDLIAKAALNLATKLRTELDSANAVIRMQEAELERKGRGLAAVGVASTWASRSGDLTDTGCRRYRHIPSSGAKSVKHYGTGWTGTGSSSAYRTGTGTGCCYDVMATTPTGSGASTSYRAVPSLASQLELQLALDTLRGSAADSVSGIGGATGSYGIGGPEIGSLSRYGGVSESSSYIDDLCTTPYRSYYSTSSTYFKRH